MLERKRMQYVTDCSCPEATRGSDEPQRIMYRYVAKAFLFVMVHNVVSAPTSPLHLTINCSSDEEEYRASNYRSRHPQPHRSTSDYHGDFCSLIHRAIPKAVKDGRFILIEPDSDQTGYSNNQVPVAVAPPKGFIPKLGLRLPKLKIPHFKVPKLKTTQENPFSPPKIGPSINFSSFRDTGEDTSAERMEKFKKGVQKMLHFVKVLGRIDQYLSERTRIVVDKLAKTLVE